VKVKLWSINRVLRYTGFRLALLFDVDAVKNGTERAPTELELFWAGLPRSKGWRRWEQDS